MNFSSYSASRRSLRSIAPVRNPHIFKLGSIEFPTLGLTPLLGSTLFLEDRYFQNPTLTAFLILFLISFLCSHLPKLSPFLKSRNRSFQMTLAGASALILSLIASPSFAQVAGGGGATCGVGMFSGLETFFSQAFASAGDASAGQQMCTLFGIMAAGLAVLFIIAIGIAVYQVGQGAEFRSAFTPVALGLIVVVASGLISQLFLGTGQ